jgi:EmrB/QacA subfamily drug resistance transporter
MAADKTSETLHRLGIVMAGALAIFMVNLDATVVNIVLPELSGRFDINAGQASLVVLAYLLSLTGTSLMFGRLSDMKGPERIFISGYLVFSVGSGLCTLTWDLWSLVIARFLQGVGGAMIFATSAVIVMRYIPVDMRGRAYAVNGMMAGIGFAMGSPVGGFLSHHFGWRAVFLVNVPVGLVGLALCMKFLTRRDHKAITPPFDIWGAVASFLMLAVLVGALHTFSHGAQFNRVGSSALATAALIGIVFIWIEKHHAHPLLTLRIFKNRQLDFALAATACYYVILQGTAFLFPFYFIHARGMTEIRTGALLFAGPLVTIILGPVAGWLCDKVGPKVPCLIGSGLFIVSVLLFMSFDLRTPIVELLGALILFGVAMSLYSAPILTLTMSHAEPDTIGILSSVKAVLPSVIGMLGVGVFAVIYTYASKASLSVGPAASEAGFHTTMYIALGVAAACLLFTVLTNSRSRG